MNRTYLPPFFTLYDLPADSDERTLKRTYARELKKIDQATQLEAFQTLRDSYEQALAWLQHKVQADLSADAEIPPPIPEQYQEPQKTEAEPDHPKINGQTSYQKYHGPAPEIIAQQAFSSLRAIVEKPQVTFSEIDEFLNTQVNSEALLHVDARFLFEIQVAAYLSEGWCDGKHFLFSSATEQFNWLEQQVRLNIRSWELHNLLEALRQWKKHRDDPPDYLNKFLEIFELARQHDTPDDAFLLKTHDILQFMSSNLSLLMWVVTDSKKIQQWTERAAYLFAHQPIQNWADFHQKAKIDIGFGHQLKHAQNNNQIPGIDFAGYSDRDSFTQFQTSPDQKQSSLLQRLAYLLHYLTSLRFLFALGFAFLLVCLVTLGNLVEQKKHSKKTHSPQTSLSAEALFIAGEDAYFGRNKVSKSIPDAIELWQAAANKGSVDAAKSLAELYKNGTEVKKDLKQALHWYEHAARLGDARSQLTAGTMYYFGKGSNVSDQNALRLFQQCATKEAYCKTMWASLLLDNGPDAAAQKKALELLHQADDAGESNAQRLLAVAQLEGSLGMSKNTEKGLDQLFRSGYGDAKSQYLIGQYYEQGKYLRRNLPEAKAWYLKATKQGHSDAITALQKLCKSPTDKDPGCVAWRELQATLQAS
ncbi:tetratricopeptide repeat protein [Undibacterium squillarum]|uniref:tetratricopeptide repeat protein n=1 Tax=Undibacterium squillarum TaxID=1131567 RepID=UPI0035B20622